MSNIAFRTKIQVLIVPRMAKMLDCYAHRRSPYFYEVASKDEPPLPPSVLSALYLGIPNLLKRENKGRSPVILLLPEYHGLRQG